MFALYPHKGLTDHKLIMGHFPWLNGLYLVDIITVVMACVIASSHSEPTSQTKLTCTELLVLGTGVLIPLVLTLVANILSMLAFMFFLAWVTGPDCCWGTLDCGAVSIIVVINYLGQDIKISA